MKNFFRRPAGAFALLCSGLALFILIGSVISYAQEIEESPDSSLFSTEDLVREQEPETSDAYLRVVADILEMVADALAEDEELTPHDPFGMEDMEYRSGTSPYTYNYNVPSCFSDWREWPSSYDFNPDAEWSTHRLPSRPVFLGSNPPVYPTANPTFHHLDLMTDVNGDGMLDYVYTWNNDYVTGVYEPDPNRADYWRLNGAAQIMARPRGCLALSTGEGWEFKYRCYTATEQTLLGENSHEHNFTARDYTPVYYGDCADTSNS